MKKSSSFRRSTPKIERLRSLSVERLEQRLPFDASSDFDQSPALLQGDFETRLQQPPSQIIEGDLSFFVLNAQPLSLASYVELDQGVPQQATNAFDFDVVRSQAVSASQPEVRGTYYFQPNSAAVTNSFDGASKAPDVLAEFSRPAPGKKPVKPEGEESPVVLPGRPVGPRIIPQVPSVGPVVINRTPATNNNAPSGEPLRVTITDTNRTPSLNSSAQSNSPIQISAPTQNQAVIRTNPLNALRETNNAGSLNGNQLNGVFQPAPAVSSRTQTINISSLDVGSKSNEVRDTQLARALQAVHQEQLNRESHVVALASYEESDDANEDLFSVIGRVTTPKRVVRSEECNKDRAATVTSSKMRIDDGGPIFLNAQPAFVSDRVIGAHENRRAAWQGDVGIMQALELASDEANYAYGQDWFESSDSDSGEEAESEFGTSVVATAYLPGSLIVLSSLAYIYRRKSSKAIEANSKNTLSQRKW